MHEAGKRCTELIEKTANALNDNVVSVMLLAVQKGNLELSIYVAVTKSVFSYRMAWKKPHIYFRACAMFRGGEEERGKIIGECVTAFPYMWFYVSSPACLSCLCLADHALSLLASVWALLLVHSVHFLLTSFLSLLARVWVLFLFVLFTAYWPFSCQGVSAVSWFVLFVVYWPFSISTYQIVSALIHPVCCLLTSLTVSTI